MAEGDGRSFQDAANSVMEAAGAIAGRPRTKKFVRINEILMLLSENKRMKECLSEIKYSSSPELVCTVGLADAVGEDEEKVESVNDFDTHFNNFLRLSLKKALRPSEGENGEGKTGRAL